MFSMKMMGGLLWPICVSQDNSSRTMDQENEIRTMWKGVICFHHRNLDICADPDEAMEHIINKDDDH